MKVYAKVEDGRVIEYPVYADNIKARGEPLEYYLECVVFPYGDIPPYHYPSIVKKVVTEHVTSGQSLASKVYISYEMVPFSIDQLLEIAATKADTAQSGEVVAASIQMVDNELINRISDAVVAEAEKILNQFAAEKNYDSIITLVGYAADPNPVLKNEGLSGVDSRSEMWVALSEFLTAIKSGTQAIPKTFAEIKAILPTPKWK